MSDAHIQVRTTPRAEVRWQLRYRIDGTFGARTFTSERDANRWLAVFKASGPKEGLACLEAAEGGPEPLSDLTVGEAVAQYIQRASGITEGTRGGHRQEAGRDILPSLGDVPLEQLDRDAVRRWINTLAAPMTKAEIAAHQSYCRVCRRRRAGLSRW